MADERECIATRVAVSCTLVHGASSKLSPVHECESPRHIARILEPCSVVDSTRFSCWKQTDCVSATFSLADLESDCAAACRAETVMTDNCGLSAATGWIIGLQVSCGTPHVDISRG